MNNLAGSDEFAYALNVIFVLLISFAFYHAYAGIKSGGRSNFAEYAPSLMTSLGLFGTFLGIFIGLLGFNTNEIDGSISQLLNGLKTAFFTSIFGMLMAIVFKVIQTKTMDQASKLKPSDLPEEVGPKEIYAVMNKQCGYLGHVYNAIGGSGDSSLNNQIKMLRTDMNDFMKTHSNHQVEFERKLWQQLNNFAEMLAKSATQQVIEALRQVIVEFNQKLTEQFGDNFKRLDESVKKLVEWQQLYMLQLDVMIQQYQLGVQAIDSTKVAVQEIGIETAKIPTNMEALGEVMHVNQHQIAELSRHLEAFVQMRDQAIIAVPGIQQKLEEVAEYLRNGADQIKLELIHGANEYKTSVQETGITMRNIGHELADKSSSISKELSDAFELLELNTERIKNGITSSVSSVMESVEENSKKSSLAATDAVTAMITKVQQGIETNNQAYAQHTERIKNGITSSISSAMDAVEENSKKSSLAATEAVSAMLAKVQQGIESSNQAYAQHTERSLGGLEKHVKEMVSRTNEGVNEQLRQFDEGIALQLNKALADLGSALLTIHRHLVEDVYKGRTPNTRE
jgi:hypothetical protein